MLGSVNLLGVYYHAKLSRILYKDEKFMISTDDKGKEYEWWTTDMSWKLHFIYMCF